MKRASFALLVVLSGCALRLPGIELGASKASTPTGTPTSSTTSAAPSAPASTGASTASREWKRVLDVHGDALETLHRRLEDQPKPGATAPDQHARWALEAIKNDTLEDVATGCAAGTFRGETLTLERRAHLKADVICPKVIDRQSLLRKTARAWGLAIIDERFAQLEGTVTRLETSGKVPVSLLIEVVNVQRLKDETALFAKAVFDELGEPVPADALSKADALLARRKAVIAKLAAAHPADRWAKSEPAAEKAVREVYARRVDVKAVYLRDADWTLVRGQFGVIERRFKNASVLAKAKDGSFCALIPAVVGQASQGSGFGGAWGVDEFEEAFPVKCP
jgi:hypothetical protein